MPQITDEDSYLGQFPFDRPDSKRAKALAAALDIRKFEIELYWKRAAYFWTLIAATFAGFLLLHTRADGDVDVTVFPLLLASIGLVLSLAWFLVNRGSKYWQENWERHVDLLEDEVMGPLYKTTLSRDSLNRLSPRSAYPYSVTRINQFVSLFITLIWLGLICVSIPGWHTPFHSRAVGAAALLAVTGGAVLFLLAGTVGTLQAERPRAEFDQRT